jgi:glycosyltransferase involved in cell wall biosynthesis
LIEGFSLVTVEAMAAGLPVVTTNAPGCADLVDHGRTGWVCPSGDVEAIAQAILSLMARPEQRAALGAQAQAASRAYDWPLVLQQYTELYSRILAQSRAPSSATVRVAS